MVVTTNVVELVELTVDLVVLAPLLANQLDIPGGKLPVGRPGGKASPEEVLSLP